MRFGVLDFFQDIINSLWAGSVLGVDIGTASIKIAEISRKGTGFLLVNYGILETKKYLEHPSGALQTSSLKIVEEDAIKLLQVLLRELKPKSKTAVASIPAFAVFVAPLEMPLLSTEETGKAVAFEARQYIPLSPSEVSIDWLKTEEYDNPQGGRFQKILLIGIPNEIIRKYKNIFKNVGLRLTALEIESFALVRAMGAVGGPTLFIDIGAEATNIIVGEGGILKSSVSNDYGGANLTEGLSKNLGISAIRAEELKRRRGLLGIEGEGELSTLILPFLDVIIQEVRYAGDAYERRYSKKIEKMVIAGGGANLLGVEKYFSRELGLPFVAPKTFENFSYSPHLTPVVGNLSRLLPVALGAAKRYFT